MKRFNTTAVCIPSKHYMVDLTERVKEISKLVEAGKYFVINKARQYGKTTTLNALRLALHPRYEAVSIDFQGMGDASFRTEESFCQGLIQLIQEEQHYGTIHLPEEAQACFNAFMLHEKKLNDLLKAFRIWCKASPKPVVLMIDEVDSATNNQVFLDFLAGLREGYINM